MKNLFSHLRGDVFGGITAGIIALPLALAFGLPLEVHGLRSEGQSGRSDQLRQLYRPRHSEQVQHQDSDGPAGQR